MGYNDKFETDFVCGERIWRHHRKLCTEIGHRILGTENDKRAAEYIESHFLSCGLETRSQVFDCPSWDHWGTIIETSSGYKIVPPEGGGCMFSLPCDVKGELVHVKTIEELKGADIRGKICVISGELRRAPIRLDRNPILLMLEEKHPLAIIVIDFIENGYLTKVIRDPLFQIPVCSVSAKSGARILDDGGTVKINIESRRYNSVSRNILASTTKEDCKKIRVIAHYDTSDTQGATDNGSGTSIMLEVAEVIKSMGLNIPIEYIAFGGEEYAMLGSTEYKKDFSNDIENTHFVVNIDSVAGCYCEPRIYIRGGNSELINALCKYSESVGNYHKLVFDKMPMVSDHKVFCDKNIPTIFMHHNSNPNPSDTSLDIPRIVSLERLENVAKIVVGIISKGNLSQ